MQVQGKRKEEGRKGKKKNGWGAGRGVRVGKVGKGGEEGGRERREIGAK